jgi:alpha-tubulin suppressor-like RCC1 family protein
MDSATPRQVSMPGLTVIEAAASGVHTCVRVQDGTLRCWGGNPQGQLGVGDLMSSYQPLLTSFINNAAQLSAGNAHTCVAERDGVAWCWGYNGFAGKFGRLGQGESAGGINALTRPGQVANLQSEHVRQLASGNGHTCALLQSGGVRCWGDNTFGQLGNNGGVQSTSPVVVQGINHAIEVASGFEHSCAVLADRTVRCWGNNSDGQLGNGTTNVSRVPVAVQGLDEVVSIGLGYYHSCAVRRNGTMLCWGRNDRGQLGDNTVVNRSTPVFVQ